MPHMSSAQMLEEMVDNHGLAQTLETLAEICYEKATHLRGDWQDDNSAQIWARAGQLIDRLSTHATIPT